VRLGRRMAEMAMASTRLGKARNMSVSRMRASSHHPPSHPATVPAAVPKAVAAATTATPDTTEMRAP